MILTVYYLLWEGKRPTCNDVAITYRTARYSPTAGNGSQPSRAEHPPHPTPFSLESDEFEEDKAGEWPWRRPGPAWPGSGLPSGGQAAPHQRPPAGLEGLGAPQLLSPPHSLLPSLHSLSRGSLLRGQHPRCPRRVARRPPGLPCAPVAPLRRIPPRGPSTGTARRPWARLSAARCGEPTRAGPAGLGQEGGPGAVSDCTARWTRLRSYPGTPQPLESSAHLETPRVGLRPTRASPAQGTRLPRGALRLGTVCPRRRRGCARHAENGCR